jgi:exosortase/archaeosortase family protein
LTELIFKNKTYRFNWTQILMFILGTVGISLLVWYGTAFFWQWTHKLVISQTCDVINWITSIGWTDLTIDYQQLSHSFEFIIPERGDIGFENACTGVQAIAIFAGLIISTPHSLDKTANRNIWPRKIIALVISSAIFYVVNLLRMVIQLNLYYGGADWNDIHVSISAASSFVAAIIILFMHRLIPEFVLSIMWTGVEVKLRFKRKREGTQKVETNSIPSQNNTVSEIKKDILNTDIKMDIKEKEAKKENYNNQFL